MKTVLAKLLEITPYEHRVAIVDAMLLSEYCEDATFEQELINQTADHPDLPVDEIVEQYKRLSGE